MTATPQPCDLLRRGDVLDLIQRTESFDDEGDRVRSIGNGVLRLPASPEAAALAAVAEAAEDLAVAQVAADLAYDACDCDLFRGQPGTTTVDGHGVSCDLNARMNARDEALATLKGTLASLRAAREGRA